MGFYTKNHTRAARAAQEAGLDGEFATAAVGILDSIQDKEGVVIALCLVAQEIRNLALHVRNDNDPGRGMV